MSGSAFAATPSLLSLLAGYRGGARAQGGASGGTLRVAWWGGNDRAQRTQQAIDLFTKRYPQWKFNVEFTNYFAYWDKINTQAAGGALPRRHRTTDRPADARPARPRWRPGTPG